MSFRTIVISKQAKLSYKNKYLVVKNEDGEKYVHFSEIDSIVVDSISVSVTSYLLKELCDNKINIVFCDEKHNPFGEITAFYSSHNSSKKIIQQSNWSEIAKDNLWEKIVKNKITNQALMLNNIRSDKYELLLSYVSEIIPGDKTNREGHAAKVYFNELFGKTFVRNSLDPINAALNYGYGIILSTFNKEIVSLGYLTQLGIHHKNEFNPFNLTCDLMEPFRIVIDKFVFYNQNREFNSEYKMDIISLLNNKFKYDNKEYTLKDIIKMYVKNVIDSMEDDTIYKGFILYEE